MIFGVGGGGGTTYNNNKEFEFIGIGRRMGIYLRVWVVILGGLNLNFNVG